VVRQGAYVGNSINPFKSIAKKVEFAKENGNPWLHTIFLMRGTVSFIIGPV